MMNVDSKTLLIGGAVLVVVLAIALSQGTPTKYSPAVGSDASLYAQASQNYATQAEQDRLGRQDAISGLVTYASDRFNFELGVFDIAETNRTARYGIDSNERLGSQQIAANERMHQDAQNTARNSSNNSFWGGLVSGLVDIGKALLPFLFPPAAAGGPT